MDLGDLACKHGLNEFDLNVLDEEFKKLSMALTKKNESLCLNRIVCQIKSFN